MPPGPGNRFQLAKLPRPRTFLRVPFNIEKASGATDRSLLSPSAFCLLSFVDFNWQNSRNAWTTVLVTAARRRLATLRIVARSKPSRDPRWPKALCPGLSRPSSTFFPRDGLTRVITEDTRGMRPLCFSNAFDSSYVLLGRGEELFCRAVQNQRNNAEGLYIVYKRS